MPWTKKKKKSPLVFGSRTQLGLQGCGWQSGLYEPPFFGDLFLVTHPDRNHLCRSWGSPAWLGPDTDFEKRKRHERGVNSVVASASAPARDGKADPAMLERGGKEIKGRRINQTKGEKGIKQILVRKSPELAELLSSRV